MHYHARGTLKMFVLFLSVWWWGVLYCRCLQRPREGASSLDLELQVVVSYLILALGTELRSRSFFRQYLQINTLTECRKNSQARFFQ